MLRSVVDEEYLPEFSTLVVRDKHLFGQYDGVPERLTESAFGAQPGGTVAVAGAGWLKAAATGDYHEVRLEAHDSEPSADTSEWLDVLETPYLSVNGSIGLSTVTGGDIEGEPLLLGDPGRYRVRVSRRGHPDSGDIWRLQFWPVTETASPRWLARDRPAVQEPRDRWQSVLGHTAYEPVWVVNGADSGAGATVAEIEAWCVAHGRRSGWLDDPIWSAPPVEPPTGDADLDAEAARRRSTAVTYNEQERARLAGIARQLGVPAPSSRRDLLSLLVAAGPLTYDESTARYRRATPPPLVRDVLELSPEELRAELGSERFDRYCCVTADLVAVVMWSPDHRLRISRADLASLLLTSPEEADAVATYALDTNSLTGSHDLGGLIDLTLRARQQSATPAPVSTPLPPPLQPTPTPEPPSLEPSAPEDPDDDVETSSVVGWVGVAGPDEQAPPAAHSGPVPGRRAAHGRRGEEFKNGGEPGLPPRAGIVDGGGGLVVWRDGEPVVLARPHPYPKRPARAIETAYGTVLLYWGLPAVLVGPGGETSELGGPDVGPSAMVSADGRFLAMSEKRYGRRPRSGLQLVDLADGTMQVLPWDDSRDVYVAGVQAGVVLMSGEVPGEQWPVGWRWVPGSDPERSGGMIRQVDPLSGAVLTHRDAQTIVVTADGTEHPVEVDGRLAPGGERLYAFRDDPPAVTLFELETGVTEPRVIWLPHGSSVTMPAPVVWEDRDHLLVPVGYNADLRGALGVRVDVGSGELEVLGGGDVGGNGPMFVEPLLTAPAQAPGER